MNSSESLVLIVEDDPLDQFLIRNALQASGFDEHIYMTSGGEEALELLDGGFKPSVIVTDLKMPGIGGFGLLNRLKQDERYRRIPAIVFSTSAENEDIAGAYDRCANSYIVKPHSAAGYQRFAERLSQYWLEENRLPN